MLGRRRWQKGERGRVHGGKKQSRKKKKKKKASAGSRAATTANDAGADLLLLTLAQVFTPKSSSSATTPAAAAGAAASGELLRGRASCLPPRKQQQQQQRQREQLPLLRPGPWVPSLGVIRRRRRPGRLPPTPRTISKKETESRSRVGGSRVCGLQQFHFLLPQRPKLSERRASEPH